MLEPDQRLDVLLSPDAQAVLERLSTETMTPQSELRLSKALRREYSAELVAAVLGLLVLRQRGRGKFSRAQHMYFTRRGLEQASGEAFARHQAHRFEPFSAVADLCCGIGGDLIALAGGRSVLAVDNDAIHLRMAELNAAVYDVAAGVRACHGDVRAVDLDGVQAAFVDPTRRVGDRRLRAGTSEPPLAWCFGLVERVPALGIKAAPGVPLDVVPDGWEIEFVAEGRELKEALLWSPSLATTPRRATLLPEGATLVAAPGPPVEVAPPGAYLVDPSPAVTRAGLVEALGRSLGAWQIDRQIAFLSATQAPRTPFGRTLRVEASLAWNLKHLRQVLRELRVGAVDIRKRGSAVDVDELRRRLNLEGERAATVVLTRVLDRPWALVCTDL